jgi:signal transduction histidine kinase
MKTSSPILLFLLLFCFSCGKDNQLLSNLSATIDSTSYHIKRSQDSSLSIDEKTKSSDKAVLLAEAKHDNHALYQSLYIKINNDLEIGRTDFDSSLELLRKVAFKENNPKYIAGYYQQEGILSKTSDNAYRYFLKAKNKYLEINDGLNRNDSLSIGFNLLKLAEIANEASEYNEVQNLATQALTYVEKDSSYMMHLNTMIGLSLNALKDYDEALYYHNTALSFAKTDFYKNIIKNNIAAIYTEKKDYKNAISIFSEILSNNILDEHIESKARTIGNFGHVLFLNNEDGLSQMLQSLKIKDSINDEFGMISSNMHLSEYYFGKNKMTARKFAEKAYHISNQLNDEESELEALELLTKLAENKEELSQLFSEYTTLNKNINLKKQTAKNQFAKLRFDTKDAEEKLLTEKAENTENKLIAERAINRNILTLAFLIFLILLGYLFFKSTRAKHIQEKQQEVYNTETRISKKVHDELANDVYNIMNFANNHNIEKTDKKEFLLASLDSVYNRTRDISRENSPIDLGTNYDLQLKQMLSDYQTEDLNVMIIENDALSWNLVNENKKTTIFRVLQELMINMKKHSQASLTVIKFDGQQKNMTINYSDNGIGFVEGKTFFKNGLQNAENRISGINGTITFDKNANKGVKILIDFPY